jgi:hypothetical protein
MKIVYVSVSMAELKKVADSIGGAIAEAFVKDLFAPMIKKGSCKRVK